MAIWQTHVPWMVTGDSNGISSTVEKLGGRQTNLGAIHDFQHCMSHNGLIDAGYQSEHFTWCNNREAARETGNGLTGFLLICNCSQTGSRWM